MTAKERLKYIRLCDARINTMLEEIDHLKAMVLKITPTLKPDVVTSGGNSDKLGDAIAKIVDLEKELDREIDSYVDRKKDVKADLDKLSDPDQFSVLHKRYVQNKAWKKIVIEMGMSTRQVFNIHNAGLDAIERMRNENIRNERTEV